MKTRKEDDSDLGADLLRFATRGARAQVAVDRLTTTAPPATESREALALRFAHLRAAADLLLALYLLDHPDARPSRINVLELVLWAAEKAR